MKTSTLLFIGGGFVLWAASRGGHKVVAPQLEALSRDQAAAARAVQQASARHVLALAGNDPDATADAAEDLRLARVELEQLGVELKNAAAKLAAVAP